MKILEYELTDVGFHDDQHYTASMVAMITGLTIFVTYYFFSRAESNARGGPGVYSGKLPWDMPWWYFVIGGILAAFTASSVACALSIAIRPREITIKKS